MHRIQIKLLDLAKIRNVFSMKLREIGRAIGEEHPQTIKHKAYGDVSG